ncbi:MAG TPA: TatD family hydrolase, partial [Candidatus Eremiobacteraeota bacterium]|nr:TatD family hydrolase [Candidatus Eremiobacteraeota bacterium]
MIETHAHLDTDRYDEDRDSVIKNALKNGVKKIINVSSDLSSLKKVKTLSMEYEEVYITFGIQPHSAYEFDDEILEIISTIAKEEKVVAIGEIGLDYHYNFSLPEIQRKVFREQIRMAKNLKLPLVIHMRESFEDTLE